MCEVRKVIDMMGREVSYHFPPRRIVSLVPSQTEYLLDIQAPVLGRTKFCIHPAKEVSEVQVIGGTKNFKFDAIDRLKPDLIIGNKEENYKEGIDELAEKFPVWMSDIYTLEDAFQMMEQVAIVCDRTQQANAVIGQCQRSIKSIRGSKTGRVLYLMWRNPWMAAGRNTFIDYMLSHLGYENVVNETRYPELSDEEINTLKPDQILLSSEPFPF